MLQLPNHAMSENIYPTQRKLNVIGKEIVLREKPINIGSTIFKENHSPNVKYIIPTLNELPKATSSKDEKIEFWEKAYSTLKLQYEQTFDKLHKKYKTVQSLLQATSMYIYNCMRLQTHVHVKLMLVYTC